MKNKPLLLLVAGFIAGALTPRWLIWMVIAGGIGGTLAVMNYKRTHKKDTNQTP